jgi:hypothetical protein
MKRIGRIPVWLLLIAVMGGACDSRHPWEGRYSGRAERGPAGAVTLSLDGGGKGLWTVEHESTPLRWSVRDGAIWLHLNSGGVMVARPIPGQPALTLELPGVGSLTLSKAGH